VKLGAARAQNVPNYVEDSSRFTLLPVNARKAYAKLVDKQPAFQDFSENHAGNALTLRGNGKPGILVSGLGWNYLKEAMGDALDGYNLLRIGVYPLPVKKIRQLLDASSEVWIVEEGYPFIERYVSALGLMRERPIHGKLTGALPRMGELTQDTIRRCFGLPVSVSLQIEGLSEVLVGRPPRLCDKCPHTDAYIAINQVLTQYGPGVRVMGDIGCYTLGYLQPYNAIHSCLCMGSSIGMAIGAAHTGMTPSLCVIGDGTFTHSGMAPLLDAARDNTNIKVFILDNSIVAMTGGQPTMATDEEVVDLVAGLGVPREHIRIVVPLPNRKEQTLAIINEELPYKGLSVIIARRACVTYAKQIKLYKRACEEQTE
jgi:indolepyruvate ferredoxin oxidoreductase alpha subunit